MYGWMDGLMDVTVLLGSIHPLSICVHLPLSIHPFTGIAILKREFGQTIDLILQPRQGEDPKCKDVCMYGWMDGCMEDEWIYLCILFIYVLFMSHGKILITHPSIYPSIHPSIHSSIQARDYWADTKDAKGTLALLPRAGMSIEFAVLKTLDKLGPQVGR